MLNRQQPGRKRLLWIAAFAVVGILAWGGRRLYCHFDTNMSGSASPSVIAAQDPLPLVTVVNPIRRPAIRSVSLAASVEAFQKATLYSKVAGYLQWIKVDIGDRVQKGEVIAVIEVPEMEKEHQSAKAVVLEAQAVHERAKSEAALKELTFKRLASIQQSQPQVISQQEVDVARTEFDVARGEVKLAKARIDLARSEVERLETLMEYARIKSPYKGVVTERFVDPGALIQEGTSSSGDVAPIVRVVNMDKVRVYVYVAEPDAPFVDRGDPVLLKLDAFPGREFRGEITRFAIALDPKTRTMKTEIDLENPGHLIRPGMYGEATLELDRQADALFLQVESVHDDAEGTKYVYAVTAGICRKVPIQTGLDDGVWVQVKGLQEGDMVVLTSTETLEEGMAVRPVKTPS